MTTVAMSQSYGNGYECSPTVVTDCENTPPWEVDAVYDVICCCGTGGPGSAGTECTCTVTRYYHPLTPGAYCYLNSCHTFTETPCTKGPNPGNVYWPVR